MSERLKAGDYPVDRPDLQMNTYTGTYEVTPFAEGTIYATGYVPEFSNFYAACGPCRCSP